MNQHLAQINMIKQQLRTGNVIDESILDLYQNIPREKFVPDHYRAFAYSDMQIPLPQQQTMLTPLEEAIILQNLNLQGQETVLEIGTGTGFLTCLLSQLAQQVISVDCFPEFTAQAEKNCQTYGCKNIEFLTGDASQGWVTQAPYDVIVITGALPTLTETFKLQVLLGGKLFAILGKSPIMHGNLYQVDHQGHWTKHLLFETNIPLLIDKHFHQSFVF